MVQLKKYELTEDDFERFRRLINEASGIFFDRSKKDVLRLGLSDRAEATGSGSLSDYYDLLTTDAERETELKRLLANLSVQETQFFRNRPQFDALHKYVIPEIIRRKAREHHSVRVWSAGCSTGQEPYSVAMTVLDVLPDPEGWAIEIMGTDLNDEALEAARRGWYPDRRLNGVDRPNLEKFFRQEGKGYAVAEPLRRLVRFERHNLVTDPLPIGSFGTCDVVFCRNVIIYFTHETAKYVIEHFFDILNPGGYLFLGHSETLWKMSAKYSLVEMGDAFIYRKPLPRSLEGRRFIPERRLRDIGLPPHVRSDRRQRGNEKRAPATPQLKAKAEQPEDCKKLESTGAPEKEMVRTGRLHLDLGEYDKAVTCFSSALEQNRTDDEAYFLMGLGLEKQNDLEGAAECYRKAIYCNEAFSLARYHLGNVLERTGRLKDAIREYRNAAQGFREHPPGAWESELEVFDIDALVNLCEWKIESLGSQEG